MLDIRKLTFISACASGALTLSLLAPSAEAAPKKFEATYEVTIINLMRGQILSPATVWTHTHEAAPLFVAGEAASEELAHVAEDADASLLLGSLASDDDVLDVKTLLGDGGPILPGEHASVRIQASRHMRKLSLAAMLVTTNDAFVAVEGLQLPTRGSRSSTLVAWDAGSEANTELCAHIPGPPCGSGGVRMQEGAEGFVHVHAGIHGVGDLDPARMDFRNPVAKVVVRRVD